MHKENKNKNNIWITVTTTKTRTVSVDIFNTSFTAYSSQDTGKEKGSEYIEEGAMIQFETIMALPPSIGANHSIQLKGLRTK